MKKEEILESLLTNAEKIDSYNGYSDNMNFMFSFAVLKINPSSDELDPEYNLYKDSNTLTYKRLHAYIVNKDGENFLYMFKNSVPGRTNYVSKENDNDLFSNNLKDSLIYTIDLYDKKKINPEDNFFRCYKIILRDSQEVSDIDEKREYILENIRKNSNGQTVCWHIYPSFENGKKILNILEHNNPNDPRLANITENDTDKDIHYLPIEKDSENWQNYINP